MTVLDPTVDRTDHGGDHDRFAHIVEPSEAVTQAYIFGTEVVALCGKKWVPSRDPQRYPLCPACKEVALTRRSHPDASA